MSRGTQKFQNTRVPNRLGHWNIYVPIYFLASMGTTMSTIILYIYMFIFFFFLYLLPMACEMKNNEVQTFLRGPEVVVPRYRFGDEDPKNHGICVYIYIYIYIYIYESPHCLV